jgi:hypothetical protein
MPEPSPLPVRRPRYAPPLCGLIARQVELAIAQPGGREAFAALAGSVDLRSGSRCFHLRLAPGLAEVGIGSACAGAPCFEYRDLRRCERLDEPDAVQPAPPQAFAAQLLGALRIRDPDWRRAAADFWGLCETRRHRPAGLVVQCAGDADPLALGDASGSLALAGAAADLGAVLTGRRGLLAAVFRGQIRIAGSYRDISLVSGLCDALRFGSLA